MKFRISPKNPKDTHRADILTKYIDHVMAIPFEGENLMMLFVVIASFIDVQKKVTDYLEGKDEYPLTRN